VSDRAPLLLVVDDEPGILKLLDRFARKMAFDVATASSGREALQQLQHRKVAVALVDLRMPDVDGLEVLKRIRAADPDCQVILSRPDMPASTPPSRRSSTARSITSASRSTSHGSRSC
jgi:CheY-like chemotaxis protein